MNDYRPSIIADRTGPLKIYKKPIKGIKYFIGADFAEGKLIEKDSKLDPDYTVFDVSDQFGETVAVYRSRCRPEDAALPLVLLAILYNRAKVNGERNSVGEVVWVMFKQTGYSHIYLRSGNGPYHERAWNRTNQTNRKTMLVELRLLLRRHPEFVVDENAVHEIASFIINNKGKPEAMSGEHDDWVMAKSYTYIMIFEETGVRIEVFEEPPPPPPDPLDFIRVMEENGIFIDEAPEEESWDLM